MKYGYLALALIFYFRAAPATAFELKSSEREKPRLKIELESAPSQVQQDLDRYVAELAASARRDLESPPQKNDPIKEQQAKAVNPLVLFRW